MRIILNADDFGFDADSVKATIDCFQFGALTSATIMPKMAATREAIEFARSNPQFSFGVHLTLGGDGPEVPLSRPQDVPDLVGPDGHFLQSNRTRLKALLGRLPVDQLEREITAQIQFIREAGVPISHVDSHGHQHKFAPVRKALSRVLPRFDIRRVRGVQDVYLRKPLKSPTYWMGAIWRRRLMKLPFVIPDHFYMPASAWDDQWQNRLLELLPRLRGEYLEVGVHPGYAEGWRDQERRTVQDFARRAIAAGHRLAGWNDLPRAS
jgi:predicted glycoside hydrolase/deacetylase ChbG (UPF0249 family)